MTEKQELRKINSALRDAYSAVGKLDEVEAAFQECGKLRAVIARLEALVLIRKREIKENES